LILDFCDPWIATFLQSFGIAIPLLHIYVLLNFSLLSCYLAGSQLQQPKVNRISFEQKMSAKATLRVCRSNFMSYRLFWSYYLYSVDWTLRDCKIIINQTIHETVHSNIGTFYKLYCIVEHHCILKAIWYCLHIVILNYSKSSAMVIVLDKPTYWDKCASGTSF
jgi:hypothetical protein